jgi:hypothetical protein
MIRDMSETPTPAPIAAASMTAGLTPTQRLERVRGYMLLIAGLREETWTRYESPRRSPG